jgi:hypothetical protein
MKGKIMISHGKLEGEYDRKRSLIPDLRHLPVGDFFIPYP